MFKLIDRNVLSLYKKIVPNPLLPHTVNKTKVGLLSRISLALP
jgi:hypothetical protein